VGSPRLQSFIRKKKELKKKKKLKSGRKEKCGENPKQHPANIEEKYVKEGGKRGPKGKS